MSLNNHANAAGHPGLKYGMNIKEYVGRSIFIGKHTQFNHLLNE